MLKMILLFGLFISSVEEKKKVYSVAYGFKVTSKTCPRCFFFLLTQGPYMGSFGLCTSLRVDFGNPRPRYRSGSPRAFNSDVR